MIPYITRHGNEQTAGLFEWEITFGLLQRDTAMQFNWNCQGVKAGKWVSPSIKW